MTRDTSKRRTYVELKAYWGNDDAESSIKISSRRWNQIRDGADYVTSAWGWYEGSRFSVEWRFHDGEVTLEEKDGTQCVVDLPVSELIVLPPAEGATH